MADQQQQRRGPPTPRELRPIEGRVPPHDLGCEAAVLSAIILKPEAINEVRELLRGGAAFYSASNRRIYECALELWDASQKVDNVTITRLLRDREFLQQVGGVAYIAQITDATPAIANVEAHARLVFDLWRRRQAIMVSQEVGASGYLNEFGANSPGRVQEYIDGAAEKFLELSMHLQKRDLRHVGDVLHDAYESLQAAKARGSAITGMCTGLTSLDETISGLQRGDLYIIAARPSKGKTALVIRMLLGLARTGEPCALFSLEMPDVQIAHRILASEAKVDISKLRKATIDPEGWSRLTGAVNEVAKLPLWIDDGAALTMPELRGRVRRFNAKRDIEKLPKLSVVAVDYLQLMTVPRVEGGRWTNREQQVADNSRGLKRMAKDDGLAMVVLAQLNREIEKRGGEKRPQLSDIRECVTGDTLVALPGGLWVPIASLVGRTPMVMSEHNGEIVEARAAAVWRVGRRAVVRVELTGGHVLRATRKHRLRTRAGWVKIADLKVGGVVAVALKSGKLGWRRVVRMEPSGNATVFDITVPETSAWVAGRIVCHNSGSVEQDADTVMFVHRPDSKDGGDTGQAEIIVAKQRNGPTMSVDLAFIAKHAHFENLARDENYEFDGTDDRVPDD